MTPFSLMMLRLALLIVLPGVSSLSLSTTRSRTAAARTALLEALQSTTMDEPRIVHSLLEIERAQKVGFVSGDFIDLAVAGDWVLAYPKPRASNVTITAIRQKLELRDGAGTSRNLLEWTLDDETRGGVFETHAVVSATKEDRSSFAFQLDKHFLRPRGFSFRRAAVEPQDVVAGIARAAPPELFDPHHTHDTLVYADPHLKVTKAFNIGDDDEPPLIDGGVEASSSSTDEMAPPGTARRGALLSWHVWLRDDPSLGFPLPHRR
mmetsp:Transcript_21489/g.66277  ORF Transcript_21489/g.66277 Transcript_21489/m.66277 type:complete len:264 (+) Transcript_21489:54-845(+)